jgi:hypothetical protein
MFRTSPQIFRVQFPRHDMTLSDSPNGRSEAGFGRDKVAGVS